MRSRGAALILAGVVLLALWLLGQGERERSGLGGIPNPLTGGDVVEQELGEEEEEGGGLSPIGEWLYVQTVGDRGRARMDAYRSALEEAARTRGVTARERPEVARATWAPVESAARGGRVADVAVDLSAGGVAYAATAAGGVWRTEDAGLTWVPAWSPTLPQTMGSIASAADGTLYAGTGEPAPTRAFAVSAGSGVYASGDGGRTWRPSGLADSGSVARIAVDPQDPDRVLAAAAGHPVAPGGERGVFLSEDSGDSWRQVLRAPNDSTGAIDLAIDPADPRTVLAALWERDGGRLVGGGSGLWHSSDGGETWRPIRLPGAPRMLGRIGVAFAPSASNRAYAIVSNDAEGRAVGLWRSDDGGKTWRRTAADPESLGQSLFGWWFGRVWVDPVDPDRVFLAGTTLVESTDGGATFEPLGLPAASEQGLPVNQHAMAWDPNRAGLVYLGTDVGMLRSVANAGSGSWVGGSSQGWAQHFTGSGPSWTTIDPAFAEGPPDPPQEPYGTVTAITSARSDPDVQYMGTAEGMLWRSDDHGESFERLEDRDGADDLPLSWVTLVVVHPGDPDRAYAVFSDAGGQREPAHLVETRDGGETWTAVTGDLPRAPVNDLLPLPGGALVAATDVGVYLTSDGSRWFALGTDLPPLPVLDLRFRGAERVLVASTFGLGLRSLELP